MLLIAVHRCRRKLTSREAKKTVHLYEDMSDDEDVSANDGYEDVFTSGYAEVGNRQTPGSALQLKKNIAYASALKNHN